MANTESKLSASLIKKGIFAIAVVAIAGASGVVFAATKTTQTNGYGNQQAAIDAVNLLNTQFDDATTKFVSQVKGDIATAKTGLGSGAETGEFATSFDNATTKLLDRLAKARADFLAQVQQAANTAESKDQFIDRYNHLKADYFNELDAAKNDFAASVSPMGDHANQVKDQFMNSFNADRDGYGNQLEVIKNQFANTISNL